MIKVLFVDGFDTKIIDALNEIPEVVTESASTSDSNFDKAIANCDALVLDGEKDLPVPLIESSRNLKLIVRRGNCFTDSDMEIIKKGEVELRSTPNATATSVAEYGLAVLLGMCRHIGPVYFRFKNGEKSSGAGEGVQLKGKTAGVIGYGRIGKEVGKKLKAIGMEVCCFDYRDLETDEGIEKIDLKSLLMKSDVIMVHLPKNRSSVNLISEEELALLKKQAVIVDISGGGVIDKTALMKILDTERIYAVALDLSDSDDTINRTLSAHKKAFPAPRMGEKTKEARELSGFDVISHLRDFFNV